MRGGLGCDVLGAPCRRAANSVQPVHGRRLSAERPSLNHIAVPLQIHLLLPIVLGVQGGHNDGSGGLKQVISGPSNKNSSCWGSHPGHESEGGDEGLPRSATTLGSHASTEEKGIFLSGVKSVAGEGNQD